MRDLDRTIYSMKNEQLRFRNRATEEKALLQNWPPYLWNIHQYKRLLRLLYYLENKLNYSNQRLRPLGRIHVFLTNCVLVQQKEDELGAKVAQGVSGPDQ